MRRLLVPPLGAIACLLWMMVMGEGFQREELIYIYDTPEWQPIISAPLSPRSPNEKMDVVLNGGAGPVVDKSLSLYHTDQYSLFQLMYNRALRDPRRTRDPSKATTFIIPYDFASDVAYMSERPNHNVGFDFRRCPLGATVTDLLNQSPWFQQREGRNHLLLVGMNYAMDHYILKPKVCIKSLIIQNHAEQMYFVVQSVPPQLYKLYKTSYR